MDLGMEHQNKNRYFAAIMLILFISAVSIVSSCGSPKNENVKVRSYANSEKSIESFKILKKYNPEMSYDATGAIDQVSRKITVFIKQSADVHLSSLKPSFTFKGSYVSRNDEVQQTGMETVDFDKSLNTPVEYTVYAEDGSYLTYSVVVQFGQIKPAKPGAISLSIKKFPYVNNTLIASYYYFDSNGDSEGETEVSWYCEKTYGVDDFELLHTAKKGDVDYLKFTLPASTANHRIKLVITPKSDPINTSRWKDGVNQNEENGDATSILSKTTVKKRLEDCVVINEFRASTTDETVLSDDGTTQKVICKGTTNEFIELYNPTEDVIWLTDYSIDVQNGAGYSLYVNFSTTHFVLPTPTYVTKLKILPGKCFLVTNSLASNEIKKIADVIVDVGKYPAFPGISDNSGVIRLKNDSNEVVDLVGYGPVSEYEGTRYAPSAVIDKSIGRTDGIDINQNSIDFVVKASTPMSGGDNIVDPTPPVATDITVVAFHPDVEDPESGDLSFLVQKSYLDVNYDNEGICIYRWRPFYCAISDTDFSDKVYVDGLTADGSVDPDAKIVFTGPFDSHLITITTDDFDKIPDECILYLEIQITPVSITGDDPDTDVDETIGSPTFFNTTNDSGLCLPKNNNAKLLICQIFPYRNIVNLYALRGGSLENLSLTLSKYKIEMDDPNIDELSEGYVTDFRIFLGKGGGAIKAGKYMAVSIKPGAALDGQSSNWDGRCSIKANAANTDTDTNSQASFFATDRTNDNGYLNSVGGAVSVSELTGVVVEKDRDGNDVEYPQYANKDMFVFAVGEHPCEHADAFKRAILHSNFVTVTANCGKNVDPVTHEIIIDKSDYAWYISNQTFPKKSDYLINPGPPEEYDMAGYNNYFMNMLYSDVVSSVDAGNDYFKIPISLSHYIVYRPPYSGMTSVNGKWYYDYYAAAYATTPQWSSVFPAINYVPGVEYIFNNVYESYIPSIPNMDVIYDSSAEADAGIGSTIHSQLFKTDQYMVISDPGIISFKASPLSTDIPMFKFVVKRDHDNDLGTDKYQVSSPTRMGGYTFCSYADSYITNKENMRIIRGSIGPKYIDTNTPSDFQILYDAISTSYLLVEDNWLP